jgi:hypothetical protein
MVKLVNAWDLKSHGCNVLPGSTPGIRTKLRSSRDVLELVDKLA